MKVHDLRDDDGRSLAFEVDNAWLGRRGVCRIVTRIPGARVLKQPIALSWLRESEFLRFEIDGAAFVAVEPFGDNSRYWIGPDPPRPVPETERVRAAFAAVPDRPRWAYVVLLLGMLALLALLARAG